MTSPDAMARHLLEGSTMTLPEDGSWSQAIRVDPSLGTSWARETGTWSYDPEGQTLRLRSTEGRVVAYRIHGDSLS